MGRGNLSASVALAAVALALAAPASAAPSIPSRVVADGAAVGMAASGAATTQAFIALARAATAPFAARLPDSAKAKLATVDFSRTAVLAIFGEFGCRDHRIVLGSLVQRRTTLAVGLVTKPLPPGTVECMAIFATYRLVSIPKASLRKPYPARASVTLA